MKVLINNFHKGVSSDLRINDLAFSRVCRHFDNYTAKHRLVPFRDMEAGDTGATTNKLTAFVLYSENIYALGVTSGGTKAEIYVSSSISNPSWAIEHAAATDGTDTATSFTLFVLYSDGTNHRLYGAATNRIWHYDISGNSFTSTTGGGGISFSTVTQGFVGSDDILYFAATNGTSGATTSALYKKDGTNNIASALTLPKNMIATDICEFGEYIAIGMKPADTGGSARRSRVILWDRAATTWNESYFLDGDLQALKVVDGYLFAITSFGGTTQIQQKLVFSYLSGTKFQFYKELPIGGSTAITIVAPQVYNNRLYFGLTADSPGGTTDDYSGVWSFGRTSPNEPFSLIFDRQANTTAGVVDVVNGLFIANDYMFINYTSNGVAANVLNKTNDSAAYVTTAVYETLILNEGDPSVTKKLKSVTIMTEPLAAGAQVVVKLKKDADTSFVTTDTYGTTVLTHSTDGDVRKTAVNDSTGAELPQYKEIAFRLESTGGAVITGLKYQYGIITDDVID